LRNHQTLHKNELKLNYFCYDPKWPHGIPRSEPPYTYDYVKDLRYVFLNQNFFKNKFPEGKNRLKNAFTSDGKVIYQVQFNDKLTTVYQISFHKTEEKIDDFLDWLNQQIKFSNKISENTK